MKSPGLNKGGELIGTLLFADGRLPESLRFSTFLRALKKTDAPAEHIAEFENDQKQHGSYCQKHGPLSDPIVVMLGDRVAFACPWCSGTDVLAAWEKEGLRS